ncbi:MAG: phosphatase PAP2 family protein [Pseudomonadota bacterium]
MPSPLSIDRFFELLTKFGDQGFVLPFVLAVGAVLWHGQARRETIWWFVATGAALGGVLMLKLVFVPCGHLLPGWDIRSPSGHSASAFAAFGGFAVLEAKFRRNIWVKAALLGGGLAFAALIAVSRLVIQVHSVPEVLLGSFVGLIAPVLLLFVVTPDARRNLADPLGLAPLLPLALLLIFDGRTLPVEEQVSILALKIAHLLGVCI